MNIQDLGALGELVGALAVIASVVYLAIQIRHGINGYRAQILLDTTSHFSRLQFELARDGELMDIWTRAEKQEGLSYIEERRVINVASSYLIGFENMYSQAGLRMMHSAAYDSRRPVIASIMGCTGVWSWWQSMGKQQFPSDFVADVEKAVKDFGINLPEVK